MLLEGGLDWKPLSLSPKDMDFIEAKHAAAREIALAFGVPPLLLGMPGDNTYRNYAEANRAFWRQTVLPLVARTRKASNPGRSGLRVGNDVNPRLPPEIRNRRCPHNSRTPLECGDPRISRCFFGPAPPPRKPISPMRESGEATRRLDALARELPRFNRRCSSDP